MVYQKVSHRVSQVDRLVCCELFLHRGTLAPRAAGTIHTDFEKGFICADVVKFNDLKECDGDETKVKAQGKMMQKGRNYEFEDGVIAHFKFNT